MDNVVEHGGALVPREYMQVAARTSVRENILSKLDLKVDAVSNRQVYCCHMCAAAMRRHSLWTTLLNIGTRAGP